MENMLVQLFESERFGRVRTVVIDDVVWFYGNDIANILGYARPDKAIRDHVDKEDKQNLDFTSFARIVPELWEGDKDFSDKIIINESGVYSLIFRSKMPFAKDFKRYVTNEILPSIRKHGAYMTEETIKKALTTPDFIIQLATTLKEEQEKNKLLLKANEDLSRENSEVSAENNYVKALNAAYMQEIYTWTDRKIINKLVARYAYMRHGGEIHKAWRFFYSAMFNKYGINLTSRITRSPQKHKYNLDYLTEAEIKDGIRTMVAVCEYENIRIDDIIVQHWGDYEQYMLDKMKAESCV